MISGKADTMNAHAQILVVLTVIFLIAGCKDSLTPQLAPEGLPLVTAKINGVRWESADIPGVPASSYNRAVGTLHVAGNRYGPPRVGQWLAITIMDFRGDSTYALGAVNLGIYSIRGSAWYQTDSNHTGNVTVTRFDTTSRTVSGTFSFTARDVYGTEVVIASEGRFDTAFSIE
jgi:hypothetical protein